MQLLRLKTSYQLVPVWPLHQSTHCLRSSCSSTTVAVDMVDLLPNFIHGAVEIVTEFQGGNPDFQSNFDLWGYKLFGQMQISLYPYWKSHASFGAAEPPVMNMLSFLSSLTRQKWLVPMGSEVKGRPSFLSSLRYGYQASLGSGCQFNHFGHLDNILAH